MATKTREQCRKEFLLRRLQLQKKQEEAEAEFFSFDEATTTDQKIVAVKQSLNL